MVKPVALAECLASPIRRGSPLPNNKNPLVLIFKGLEKETDANSCKVCAKKIKSMPHIVNPYTKGRFLPLKVKEGSSEASWMLIKIWDLKQLGIKKKDAKAAFQEGFLEELVRGRVKAKAAELHPEKIKRKPKPRSKNSSVKTKIKVGKKDN